MEEYLTLEDVCEMTGLTAEQITRCTNPDVFPQPNAGTWKREDVEAWLRSVAPKGYEIEDDS